MTPTKIQTTAQKVDIFLSEAAFDRSLLALYDHIPGIYFFIKDIDSRLITCNVNMLSLYGQKYSEGIYGKTGFDFFPANLVFSFIDDDRQVMDNDTIIRERIELNIAEDGAISWFATTKTPLHNQQGKVIGLAGITRVVGKADEELHPFRKMIKVIDYLQANYTQELEVDTLADLCNLSKSQFHRSFKKLFRMPPLQFVLKLRIQNSIKLLRNTNLNVGEIAYECGFNDQNYFARSFSKACGMSPSKFRQKFR
ncbi:MAG: AraC family transcriptional regulator [Lentisphaerales bacterium]|nr:AraC family transcriptional regulator [Lentisphaerales bacterium]